MKKKLMMSLVVMGLMFSLAACGSSSDSSDSSGETTEETVEEEETAEEEAASEEEAAEETAEEGLSGTYTGEGEGFGGTITVTLTLENGTITDCSIDGPDETESVGGVAIEELAEQVVAANGADIDGVSGATYTSDGVKEAVAAALGE